MELKTAVVKKKWRVYLDKDAGTNLEFFAESKDAAVLKAASLLSPLPLTPDEVEQVDEE